MPSAPFGGCECGGCCDPYPSQPPPSPSSMASLGKMISHTITDRLAAGDFSGLLFLVLLPFVQRAASRIFTSSMETAFTWLGMVPGLGGKLPRYMIFGTAAAALFYFLLHWVIADLSPGQHVAIVLAFTCPVALLVCVLTTCSRGAEEEADTKADPLLPPSEGAGDEAENQAKAKAKAKGVSVEDVCRSEALCWSKACDMSGLSFWPAALLAAAKLLLWHWLQPAAYLVALAVYWGEIDGVSRWLGAIVGVREVIYVALTLAALYVQPAYLLVEVNATLRKGNPVYRATSLRR